MFPYIRSFLCAFVLLVGATVAVHAAKPVPPELAPSTMIVGSFTTTYIPESLVYDNGSQVHTKPVAVPQDGAWIFGNATYDGYAWMDCDHHYVGALLPNNSAYSPLFKAGYEPGHDACFGLNCYSCSVNWNGDKANPSPTTDTFPAFLPGGTSSLQISSLNGGSTQSWRDAMSLWLAQVNVNAMQSMTIHEARANDDPLPADDADIASRVYVAASDDRIPIVPTFTYGKATFPPAPGTTFSALWDQGSTVSGEIRTFGAEPALVTVLLSIPRMKTGLHSFVFTATLPSGKPYNVAAYKVFVYNVALEATVSGGSPVTTSPVAFKRAEQVTFRLQQQDTKGKEIKITKADWKFRSLPAGMEVLGTADAALAPDGKEWGGTMHQSGLVSVNFTIQTGKISRTSRVSLIMTAVGSARTGTGWESSRNLCEECFQDLGIKNGGDLRPGLIFPTTQNLYHATAPFPDNLGGGVALAMTGERISYDKGILSADGSWALEPHTLLKPFPLYRPLNLKNDPEEWNNRYTVTRISSGPNVGYWYVTAQNYRTEWAYALNAFFSATSGPGADWTNYFSWELVCPTALPEVACWSPMPLTCWQTAHQNLSYYEAANAATDAATGQPYDMAAVATDVKWHEKNRHWKAWLVDYIAANKTRYDIGTILELISSRDSTEELVRTAIDQYIVDKNFEYALDPQGGGNEIYNDPTGRFPLVEDLPLGSAPCTLYHP